MTMKPVFTLASASASTAVIATVLLTSWSSLSLVNSFSLPISISSIQRSSIPLSLKASITDDDDNNNEEGIAIFEKWFQSVVTSKNDSNNENESMKLVRHNYFSNGRGLEFIGKKSDSENEDKAIISLPKDYVLQSTWSTKGDGDKGKEDTKSDEDIADEWDVTLAMKLLKECRLGEESSLYGYCSLLTRGEDFDTKQPCPESTAPDALRNWSNEQKEALSSSKRGQRLLNVEKKQSKEWNAKYNALKNSSRTDGFTYEQFVWSMEAVHSRAFKGDFSGQDPLKELSKALIPFAAGAFALNYVRSDPFAVGADDKLTFILLLVSCAPVILNFLSDKVVGSTMDAVMLPFIDSANHKETARSNIQFDPLKGVFTVTIEGGNCIEKDGGKNQFYISYGEKRDTELLLNYGFLNGVRENYESQEERRRLLAETFNSRSLQ